MSVKCIEKKMYDFIQKQTSPCITTVLNHVHNQHQKSKVSKSCDDKVFMHSNWTSRGRTNGGNSVINRLLPCSKICQVSSSKVWSTSDWRLRRYWLLSNNFQLGYLNMYRYSMTLTDKQMRAQIFWAGTLQSFTSKYTSITPTNKQLHLLTSIHKE